MVAAVDTDDKSRGFTVAWDHCPERMDFATSLGAS